MLHKQRSKIPDEQFEPPVIGSNQPQTLLEFFQKSPLVGVSLDLDRDKDTGRDIQV